MLDLQICWAEARGYVVMGHYYDNLRIQNSMIKKCFAKFEGRVMEERTGGPGGGIVDGYTVRSIFNETERRDFPMASLERAIAESIIKYRRSAKVAVCVCRGCCSHRKPPSFPNMPTLLRQLLHLSARSPSDPVPPRGDEEYMAGAWRGCMTEDRRD